MKAREVIRTSITVVAAVAICVWSLHGVDLAELGDALRRADQWMVFAVMLGYTAIFYLADVSGFGLVYRGYLTPRVSWWQVTVIVCGKQLLGLLFPLLTKVVAPLYFRRRWGIPVLRTLGATQLLSCSDLIVTIVFVAGGALTGGLQLPPLVLIVGGGLWAMLVLGLAWLWLPAGSRLMPKVRHSEFFAVFTEAGPRELVVQIALRCMVTVAMFGSLWLLLLSSGHSLEIGQLATFGALFLLVSQLPVSVGGFGGPQGVSVLLLTDSWHVLDRADSVAFSLLWSTAFLICRTVLSLPFAVPMVRLLARAPIMDPTVRTGRGDRCAVERSVI